MVKNGDRSVITQTSLHKVAVCVINSVTVVTQISPAAARGCENCENDLARKQIDESRAALMGAM